MRVVLLARDDGAVEAAYRFFTDALQARAGVEPGNASGVYAASCALSGTQLEVFSSARTPWRWQDRKGRPQDVLRLVAAGPWSGGLAAPSVLARLLGQGGEEEGGEQVSSSQTLLGGLFSTLQSMAGGRPIPSPHVLRRRGAELHTRAEDDGVSPGGGLRVKEVVLGCEGEAFLASQAALEGCGAVRDGRNLSMWHLHQPPRHHAGRAGGDAEEGARPAPPALRLLPSRYSALILQHSGGGGGGLEAARESLVGAGGSGSGAGSTRAGLTVEMYGQRLGREDSGQLQVGSPALRGLDLRLCGALAHAPFFAERQESFTDAVDPEMNPAPDSPEYARKSKSMACPSVVGMEVKGLIKHKLGMT